MNRKSVIATLKSVCPDKFLAAKAADGSILKYVPVFERPYDSEMMGISENGFWCVANEGRIWELKKSESGYIFYLLLYTPLKEIVDTLKKGLFRLKLPEKLIITFPFDELVLSAITSSSHWCQLALKWVEQGYPLTDEMRLYLCNNDKQSQQWLKWQQDRLSNILGL
ncbi:MAG: hypothetical protein DRR19_09405 [Candidatus Parabeggiatoa sp. nov. 1]|nr:MAG: hypothetical protein DRR19_09405 [Gammaproteobacteria bacterium]